MLLAGSSPALANITDTSQITTALGRYCVPKEGDTYEDTLVCGSVFEGKYTQGKSCSCYDSKYLTYDETLRHCKVQCPAGNNFVQKQSQNSCPSGHYAKAIKTQSHKNCPAGTQAVVYDSNKHVCPAGYNLVHKITK